MATNTYWGEAQTSEKIAHGIMHYMTASHGGYHLSAGRMREMLTSYKGVGFGADKGWFEEDCAAALVEVTFPEFFTPERVAESIRTMRQWYPHLLQPSEKGCLAFAGTGLDKAGETS